MVVSINVGTTIDVLVQGSPDPTVSLKPEVRGNVTPSMITSVMEIVYVPSFSESDSYAT
jgi:hypothetical protein